MIAFARDQYDEAVEYLTAHPEKINRAWLLTDEEPGGCLFLFADEFSSGTGNGRMTGCLTMIRQGDCLAQTDDLTEAIRSDTRIPTSRGLDDMTEAERIASLPVFAEWQRRIDAALDRAPIGVPAGEES